MPENNTKTSEEVDVVKTMTKTFGSNTKTKAKTLVFKTKTFKIWSRVQDPSLDNSMSGPKSPECCHRLTCVCALHQISSGVVEIYRSYSQFF